MMEMLEGVFTALVTPFSADGVDWDSLDALVEAQIDAGIHGLVPCGTTGESATLTVDEHDEVIRFVVDRVSGRIPVLAGAGSNSTIEAVNRTRHAQEVGADAVLHITPYYNRPSQAGLLAHYAAIAEVGLPIICYNIPSRTGCKIELDTYCRLAEIPQIVGTKEATGDLVLSEQILRKLELRVLAGDDALTLPLVCLGGHGVISVSSNIAPRLMLDIFELAKEGNYSAARELHYKLLPLVEILFAECNPGPIKAALASQDRIQEILRLPMLKVQDSTRRQLLSVMNRLEL